MNYLKYSFFSILLVLIGCDTFISGSSNECINFDTSNIPEEGTPTQFCIDDDIIIDFVYEPESPFVIANEPALNFAVVTKDSIPHLHWLPTRLLIETDQGYSEEINLNPFACIVPIEGSTAEFPFNVEWWSCDSININNAEALTESQKQEIEKVSDSRLTMELLLDSMDGGQYFFETNQIGRASVRESISKIQELPFIKPFTDGDSAVKAVFGDDLEYAVSHNLYFGAACWAQDVIPAASCPPWSLSNIFRISLDGAKENHIPVQVGGWVKASYILPDGSVKSATFTVPEMDL